MEYSSITIEINERICVLTINRPKALNALNKNVMSELDDFFRNIAPSNPDFDGIIITGSGDRSFVAGADISEFVGISARKGEEISSFGQDVFFQIERLDKPVIAVVNGFALGGGCELAMSCHLRIAEDHAIFGQPEVSLGLIPGYGGTQRLLQCIGKSKAIELLLTADVIKAEEALKLGLVNHVCEKGTGIEKATEFISKISKKGPLAIAKTIESVNAYYDEKQNGYAVEYRNFGYAIGTEDSQEGVKAFMEKRKAKFKGK